MQAKGVMLFVCLLLNPNSGQEQFVQYDSLWVRQVGRMAMLLTRTECENVITALSVPEGQVYEKLRKKVDTRGRWTAFTDTEWKCKTRLMEWMKTLGEKKFKERVVRILQRVGRNDIAKEIGKNINQEKMLKMQRYVEDYQQYVENLGSPLLLKSNEDIPGDAMPLKHVRDLAQHDLELVVEREHWTPYNLKFMGHTHLTVLWFLMGFIPLLISSVFVLILIYS